MHLLSYVDKWRFVTWFGIKCSQGANLYWINNCFIPRKLKYWNIVDTFFFCLCTGMCLMIVISNIESYSLIEATSSIVKLTLSVQPTVKSFHFYNSICKLHLRKCKNECLNQHDVNPIELILSFHGVLILLLFRLFFCFILLYYKTRQS